MRTRFLTVLLPALLVLSAAACTKSDGGKDVASVGGGSAAPSPAPTASMSHLDMAVRWAQCMREQGVPVSDPEINGTTVREGRVDHDFPKDKADAAKAVCQQYKFQIPAGPGGFDKQELGRQEARCMREHGVEAYPDPNPDGTLRVPPEAADDPQFPAAREFCRAQSDSAFASWQASPK